MGATRSYPARQLRRRRRAWVTGNLRVIVGALIGVVAFALAITV